MKLSPQPSKFCIVPFSMLVFALTQWLQPQDSVLSARMNASCTCIFRSMRLLDDSLGFRLNDRQHTFNPCPLFLKSLVRRIGCVLDCYNRDLNGSLVELRQLLNHKFESVKTFPSGEHSCCIRKRIVVPLRACLRQDVLHLVTIPVRTTLSLTDVCLAQAS